MLRARDIETLNDAYTLALQEEKIINYTKTKSNTHNSNTNSNQPTSRSNLITLQITVGKNKTQTTIKDPELPRLRIAIIQIQITHPKIRKLLIQTPIRAQIAQ